MACDTSTTITAEDLQTFKPNLVFINDVASTSEMTAESPNGVDVKTIGGWQHEFALAVAAVGWQPEIPYESGIYFADTDFNKLVGYNDNSYSPIASQLPFTTTGNWSTDQFKFKQVNSNVISVNGETGAVTIELSDLNGVPTTRTINGKSLASNISLNLADFGFTGDSNANFYEHPSFTPYSTGTSGFEFISRIVTNGEGHVQTVEKRSFDPNDISAVPSDASSTIEAGTNTTLTIRSSDEGASQLIVAGDSQGVGRVLVGQSSTTGGGINYDGNGLDDYTGAGADYFSLFRLTNSNPRWTAKNANTSDDWIFRGNVYANETDLVLTSANISTSITLEDLGYTGDLDANNYEHPTFTALNVDTTGLEVISEVVTNGEGHVTDIAKRYLDLSGFVSVDGDQTINDNKTLTGALLIDANIGDSPSLIIDGGDSNKSSIHFNGSAPEQSVILKHQALDGELLEAGFAIQIKGIGNEQQSNQKAHLEVEGNIYSNGSLVYTQNNLTPSTINAVPSNASSTIDAGTNTTLTIKSDDTGQSVISLHGDNQGSGRVFVGQNSLTGGGIEYNGDGNPDFTGAGSDYICIYHVSGMGPEWTARHKNDAGVYNWEFRGDIYTNTDKKVYSESNITYGTGDAPAGMEVGAIYLELES